MPLKQNCLWNYFVRIGLGLSRNPCSNNISRILAFEVTTVVSRQTKDVPIKYSYWNDMMTLIKTWRPFETSYRFVFS